MGFGVIYCGKTYLWQKSFMKNKLKVLERGNLQLCLAPSTNPFVLSGTINLFTVIAIKNCLFAYKIVSHVFDAKLINFLKYLNITGSQSKL